MPGRPTPVTSARVVRGCGTRQPGGAYLVASLGEGGIPLEDLVVDPPIVVDPQAIGLSTVGMLLAQTPEGKPAIIDWVGSEHYAQPADFLEEVSLFGSSRRVPTTFDFARLGPGATHLLVHAHADAVNRDWPLHERCFDRNEARPSFLSRALARRGHAWCPFKGDHPKGEFCSALWWELLDPTTLRYGSTVADFEAQMQRQAPVLREMPAFHYRGYSQPDQDVWRPTWRPAIFLRLPINRVEVVRDPGDMGHEITLSRASKAGIPVIEVDE